MYGLLQRSKRRVLVASLIRRVALPARTLSLISAGRDTLPCAEERNRGNA